MRKSVLPTLCLVNVFTSLFVLRYPFHRTLQFSTYCIYITFPFNLQLLQFPLLKT